MEDLNSPGVGPVDADQTLLHASLRGGKGDGCNFGRRMALPAFAAALIAFMVGTR
jgi:hypothetical protein